MPIYSAEVYVPGMGDGLAGYTLVPGSGIAVPAGLEAILEYRGLFMNAIHNADCYKITSIDGLNDADIRDTRDQNTDDDGETPYNSFYGGRTITISGYIRTFSPSKMRDMQQALKSAFIDVRNEYPLRFRTGDFTKDHIIYCKKIGSIAMVEQQQDFRPRRDFQISLRASDPRFLSYYENTLDVNPAPVGDLDFDESGSGDSDADPIILGANNRGSYFAKPIYRFYGPARVGVSITNPATDQSFVIHGPISPGGYFEFDTSKKTLKDNLGDNQWKMLDDDSQYVYLAGNDPDAQTSGENPLIYDGDCSRIQISWRDSWM